MEETDLLKQRIDTLFDDIKHGDLDHQNWLKKAILDHFAGNPVDPPTGKGTKEALQDKIKELETQLEQLRAKKRWFNMTKEDFYYILAHGLAFFLGYSTMMAAYMHAGHPPVSFFDWSALNAGLIAMGVTNLGVNLPTNK